MLFMLLLVLFIFIIVFCVCVGRGLLGWEDRVLGVFLDYWVFSRIFFFLGG